LMPRFQQCRPGNDESAPLMPVCIQ
jgi:hypothetical protein